MLSVASIRSAGGAANYFAKDDYYTVEGSSEISTWSGQGADDLGLAGQVGREAFEGILNGVLPSGEAVGQYENRRAGLDLTFSMPKSASVMAYVAGDGRILTANMAAVKQTMAWVETNLAQNRKEVEGRSVPVTTGKLVYALFQHDTSRALDPQAHIHAVIANLTRSAEGRWTALHADRIWAANAVIGSIYHAYLREGLERLGYRTELKGKHGTFEIAGVPRAVLEEFSQRRDQILDKANELGIVSQRGRDALATRTRDPKLNVDDRDALRSAWVERAVGRGFDGKILADAALAKANYGASRSVVERGYEAVTTAIGATCEILGTLLRGSDPWVDPGLARVTRFPSIARTQLAVASAVRILSEREAAFETHRLAKTALDLGLEGVTVEKIEHRIDQLVQRGKLLVGAGRAADHVTTLAALQIEENILGAVAAGRGVARAVIDAATAPERLQGVAVRALNAGQLAAATLILSSTDRTVAVQGIAGAGKSTMLQAVARVAAAEGRDVIGLAFQNKMVADLAESAGIKAQTIASFVLAHERFVTDRGSDDYDAARVRFEGAMLVVDEASMVSSNDMLKLHRIGDALGVGKLVLVGDRQQLSSIEAGKSFAMIQAGGGMLAHMDENIRQRTDQLRTVAALANRGRTSAAMGVLGGHVIEAERPAEHAADMWLALSPEDRAATAVFASGREARAIINERIQDGLAAAGTLEGTMMRLTVFDRVNTAREELRYGSTYRPGQTLEVGRGGRGAVGLRGGLYDVLEVLSNGKVELFDGRRKTRFDPQKLSPTDLRDHLQLTNKKDLQLRAGDRIRWTANDRRRGLLNAALARVIAVDQSGLTVEIAPNVRVTLDLSDPMLSRLDLAYSLNMHMAQGITADRAIVVMNSYERNLSNQRLFNVSVTRVRDELRLVVDDREKLAHQLDRKPGDKTSALETVGRLDIDGKNDPRRDKGFENRPLNRPPGSSLSPTRRGFATLPANEGKSGAGQRHDLRAPPTLKPDAGEQLPRTPERSLGLDL